MHMPPEPPPRLVAIHIQPCPPRDLVCRINWANDMLDGIVRMKPFDLGLDGTAPVTVYPGVGELKLEGFAPTIITGPEFLSKNCG